MPNNFFKFLKYEFSISKYLLTIFNDNLNSNNVILTDRCDSLSHWHLATCLGAKMVGEAIGANILSLEENEPLNDPPSRFLIKNKLKVKTVSFKIISNKYTEKIENDSAILLKACSEPKKILDITYKGLKVGPEIYDGVLKHKLCTVRKIDQTVFSEIKRAVRCIICLEEIFKHYNVVGGFCTHTTCSFDGVWLRFLLHKGLPVYQGYSGMESLLKIKFPAGRSRYDLSVHVRPPKKILEKSHPDFLFYLKKGEKYIEQKINGNSADWDAKKAFSSSLPFISDRKKFAKKIGIDAKKPNVFIMLHAMNDDPHVKGQHLFNDYYDWFQFTLARIGQNKKCNWIFKIHPRVRNYPDDSDVIGDIKRIRHHHIKILDENDLHSGCIVHLADAVLTAGGTAALEYVAQGIPGIIATRTGYHGYGFVKEPKSLKEYENILVSELPKIKKPKKNLIKKAIVSYYLYNHAIRNKMMNGFFSFEGNSQYIGISSENACKMLLSNLKINGNVLQNEKRDFLDKIKKMHNKASGQLMIKSDFSKRREIFEIN